MTNDKQICALCSTNEANKTNTHYLTDGVIRRALNYNGVNIRGKGIHFTLSSTTADIEMSFQNVTDDQLKEVIGRSVTDEEIEKAKKFIAYSVDYVFCKQCEDLFCEVETNFINQIYRKLPKNLTNLNSFCVRQFVYIQYFRSAVCDENCQISDEFKNKLREVILMKEDCRDIPLKIVFLETLGGEKHFTENKVGFIEGDNPYVILMNDLCLQIYENEDMIKEDELFGINTSTNYLEYINCNESSFEIEYFNDEKRKIILRNSDNPIVNNKIAIFDSISVFKTLFSMIYQTPPTLEIVERYKDELTFYMENDKEKKDLIKFPATFIHKFINK